MDIKAAAAAATSIELRKRTAIFRTSSLTPHRMISHPGKHGDAPPPCVATMNLWRNLNALSDCRPAAGCLPAPGRRSRPEGQVQNHLQQPIRLLHEELAHPANAQELLDRPQK